MRQHVTDNFGLGLVTAIDPESLKDGAASDVLGWKCLEDRIELTGGYQQLGADSVTGTVNNAFSASKTDGTDVTWKKVGAKLYVKDGSSAWAEVGSDLFTGASSDTCSFALWESFDGSWVFVSSPNSSLWKIPVANPASTIEFTSAGYRGYVSIIKSRLWVWQWPTVGGSPDLTGIQGSYLPAADIGDARYTFVDDEAVDTGDGGKAYSGTLAFKAGGATRNCFSVSITDGTETFTDNGSGTLTGSAGGTGTINYATGAWTATFNAAVSAPTGITADYYWEDDGTEGLADFSTLSSAAGDGLAHYLSQPTGGATRCAFEFNDAAYFLHETAVWRVTFDSYGDPSTNLVFRKGSGTSDSLGAVPSSEGIYFVDSSDPDVPNVRVITLDQKNQAEVISPSISEDLLDLDGWTLGAIYLSGNLVVVSATEPNGSSRTLAYSRKDKSWSKHPYPADCYTLRGDTVYYGDSGRLWSLFDGTDASGFTPSNYWIGAASDLGYPGLKRVRELWIEGKIALTQSFTVEVENDAGGWATLAAVDGSGGYVTPGSAQEIGEGEIGGEEIGGDWSSAESAGDYVARIAYTQDRFASSKIRITATGVGYASVRKITHNDVRHHGLRVPLGSRASL